MFETILAGTVLLVCAILLVRLTLSVRRRMQFDFMMQRWWATLAGSWLRLWRWPAARREANREARDAIERARDGGEWDGNVYRPKSFRKPRKPH